MENPMTDDTLTVWFCGSQSLTVCTVQSKKVLWRLTLNSKDFPMKFMWMPADYYVYLSHVVFSLSLPLDSIICKCIYCSNLVKRIVTHQIEYGAASDVFSNLVN